MLFRKKDTITKRFNNRKECNWGVIKTERINICPVDSMIHLKQYGQWSFLKTFNHTNWKQKMQ